MRRLLLLCLMLAASTPLMAEKGVVFIHGKGGKELQYGGPANAYWSVAMIRAVTKNRTVPECVCHYDGTLPMRLAARAVAAQIRACVTAKGMTHFDVVTHSFGGVVIRWILTDPFSEYGDIIARTGRVTSIAPPNAGSEAANKAMALSGKFLVSELSIIQNQNNPATENCTTWAMAEHNHKHLHGTRGRPPLPRTIYNVAGTTALSDGKHGNDVALVALSKFARLPGDDDGMVSVYSAQSVGVRWLTTKANHDHNRHYDYDKSIGDRIAGAFRP